MAKCSYKLDATSFLSPSSLPVLYAFQVSNGNVDFNQVS